MSMKTDLGVRKRQGNLDMAYFVNSKEAGENHREIT
jgi:hypothetical protein